MDRLKLIRDLGFIYGWGPDVVDSLPVTEARILVVEGMELIKMYGRI